MKYKKLTTNKTLNKELKTNIVLALNPEAVEKLSIDAERMNCKSIEEYIMKLFKLGEVVSERQVLGMDFYAIDKNNVKILKSKESGKIGLIASSGEDIVNITSVVEEVSEFYESLVQKENSSYLFGLLNKEKYEA